MHRYPDRVLFLVTDRCAAYCRYCTRSRLVSNAQDYNFHPEYEQGLRYIEAHPEVRDVLLSGGDPLLLSDKKLEHLISRLRAIKHVEFIRIGSRIPVFLPQRITPELCEIFKKYGPIWMSIHVNHPRECTAELKAACERLSFAGVPLGNQSVLLKGVNDDADVMKALVHRLLRMRVRPYYLYQMDLITGGSHFKVDVRKGIEIIRALRGQHDRLRRAPVHDRRARAAAERSRSIPTTSRASRTTRSCSAITRARGTATRLRARPESRQTDAIPALRGPDCCILDADCQVVALQSQKLLNFFGNFECFCGSHVLLRVVSIVHRNGECL